MDCFFYCRNELSSVKKYIFPNKSEVREFVKYYDTGKKHCFGIEPEKRPHPPNNGTIYIYLYIYMTIYLYFLYIYIYIYIYFEALSFRITNLNCSR